MKYFLVALFASISVVLYSSDQYPKSNKIDVTDYEFVIYLSDSYDVIRGEAGILIRHTGRGAEVVFDLVGKTEDGTGMTIEAVLVDGEKVMWEHSNNKLSIKYPEERKEGDISRVDIMYSGVAGDGLIISENKYGERTFFADNWPDRARNWIPCIDHPSDKARVQFKVFAPDHYKVVSNGILVEESIFAGGIKLTHWREDVSIPTKVMVIGVARFATSLVETVGGIDIWTYVFPENREEGFNDYAAAVEPFKFYSNTFGSYPYDKLANVQSKTMFGGMENAGCIFYSEKSVTGENKIERLMAHEIAHQWFGNSVTELDWHHIWLSEGFATYFTAYYLENKYGESRMKSTMQASRNRVIYAYERNPAPVIDTTVLNFMRLLNTNSYQKGAWVLHMLRAELGDEVFISGIRTYYNRFRNRNALTVDFKNAMEDVSGKDLSKFFDQWLYQPEIPVLSLDWDYSRRKNETTIRVRQEQSGYVFNIPVEIQVICNGVETIKTLRLDGREEAIVVETDSTPDKIVLDPKVSLLYIDWDIAGN